MMPATNAVRGSNLTANATRHKSITAIVPKIADGKRIRRYIYRNFRLLNFHLIADASMTTGSAFGSIRAPVGSMCR